MSYDAVKPPNPNQITSAHRDAKGRLLPGHPGAWQPGKSANPGGRPITEREVVAAARQGGPKAINSLLAILDNPKAQHLAIVRAAEILLDRGFGKSQQVVRLETDIAGMSNEALQAFIHGKIAERVQTIEHDPAEPGESGDE